MLQDAIKMGAKPKELLETALHDMQPGKTLSPLEDKENLPCENSFMFSFILRMIRFIVIFGSFGIILINLIH